MLEQTNSVNEESCKYTSVQGEAMAKAPWIGMETDTKCLADWDRRWLRKKLQIGTISTFSGQFFIFPIFLAERIVHAIDCTPAVFRICPLCVHAVNTHQAANHSELMSSIARNDRYRARTLEKLLFDQVH